ncbi:MAG: glycosyltransferase family 39 protein [Candidatus Gottesmanbacteria bacterium]
MKRIIFLVFGFIFLSRILLLSNSPAFFDSPEYIRLFNNPSLLEALRNVHYPIHPLYIIIYWIFNQLPISTTLYKAEFLNGFIGLGCSFIIYLIAKEFLNEKRALTLTVFASFTPYFWLSQINVQNEPLSEFCVLLSFYFLIIFSKLKKRVYFIVSSIFFGLSLLVTTANLLYLILIFGWLIIRYKILASFKLMAIYLIPVCLSVILYTPILILRHIPLVNILDVLSGSISLLAKLQIEGYLFFLRGIRNLIVVYFNYLTIPLGIIIGILALKNINFKRPILLILFWFITFFLFSNVWQVWMFGRLSIILTLIPLYYLVKIRNYIILYTLFILLIISSSFLVLPYHFQKIPNLLEKDFLLTKNDNSLLIVSNFEEPFLCDSFNCLILNSPITNLKKINSQINQSLSSGKIVYITSQAISAPYNLYDGLKYQILSERKSYPQTDGQKLTKQYRLNISKYWSDLNLKIYTLEFL